MINIGDVVKRTSGRQCGMESGMVSRVTEVGDTCVELEGFDGQHLISKLIVIETATVCGGTPQKPTMLKTINKFIKKHLDPKMQALLRAGYLNGDLAPTTKGDRVLLDLLHMKNHDELAALAQEEIDEEEENEKNK